MSKKAKQLYEFGPFRLDAIERLLLRDRKPVLITPKAFDTLVALVEKSGHVVEKDQLMERVWPDAVVEEATLAQNISTLRKALGESSSEQRYIETVPKHGYRFVASVRQVSTESADLIFEEHTRSRVLIEREQEAGPAGEPSLASASIEEPFATSAKVKAVLKWRASLVVLVVCAAVASTATILLLKASKGQSPTPAAIRSIAVLPLENLSGDPAQEYFADGMTEELISNLTQIRAFSRVISRTSMMRYRGSNKSLPEIARELNVDAVIEGSVQRSGGRVRVTAKLIPAATDSPVWTSNYERDVSDVLKLQSEIAWAVANEIRIQITAEERARLASARSVDPQAHEAYLLGRYHLRQDNEQGLRQAIEYFERAIKIAPDSAAAYAGLSDAWRFRGLTGIVDFKEAESPAREAALKALELDEQSAEGHISLAMIKQNYDWDWTGAERELRRALEIDPGSLDTHTNYGYFFMHVGRHDEAIREGEIAVQLDPLSSVTHSALGRFLYRAKRYEEALPHLLRAVELEPRSLHANYRLGELYAQMGRYDEAIAAYEGTTPTMPRDGNFQAAIARVYALMGRHREARQMLRGAKANPFITAEVYVALGDKNEAFRILEKAVTEHQLMTVLKVEPPLESLYSDPRMKALLRRMNLPTD